MAKSESGTASSGSGGFYWTRFSSYKEFSVPASSKKQRKIKCDGEPCQYLLSPDIALSMLARFLKVKDSQSAIKYLEEYGAPLSFPASDIDVETILGLANSLSAVRDLIVLEKNKDATLSDLVDLTEVPPWNRCAIEFNLLSYSHILKSKLRVQYPGRSHWDAFVQCHLGARAKKNANCSDLERLVLAFYEERELKQGLWLDPRLKQDFYSGNLLYGTNGAFATMPVPETVFSLPFVSTEDWQADREKQARYVFGNALKQWFDVLLSQIYRTPIWCRSAESNEYSLVKSFRLDTPWSLMCMELHKSYLGMSKYSYCATCREPYLRGPKAKGCSDACAQKRYRERRKARKEGN